MDEPERVLTLAADSPEALAALLDTDDSTLLSAPNAPATSGRSRLGIVAPDARRLALARRAVAKGRAWQGRSDVWFTPSPLIGPGAGKLAFVFPGLEGDFTPRVEDVAAYFGLRETRSATPAQVGDVGRHGFDVVGVGRLLDAALRRMGVVPDAVAGHSVGEWTAMTAAGVYAPDEVSDFMEAFDPDSVTVPGLAFGAIGAPAERVLSALAADWPAAGIVLSHDNAPGQSMVCGPDRAVDAFVRSFRAEGVLSQVLPFRSGFHTPMLKPYLAPIEEATNRFRLHPPTVPSGPGPRPRRTPRRSRRYARSSSATSWNPYASANSSRPCTPSATAPSSRSARASSAPSSTPPSADATTWWWPRTRPTAPAWPNSGAWQQPCGRRAERQTP